MLGAMSSRTLPLPPPVSWSSGLVGEYPGQQSQITLPGGVPMIFCWCPPPRPEDWLGTPKDEVGRDGDDRDLHLVPFKAGFWMAKYPVSQAQWHAVMGSDPSCWKGGSLPVENVNWEEARAFCEKTGLTLPNEARWEYACRAGSQRPFGVGEGLGLNAQQANFAGECPYGKEFKWISRLRTVAQGSFPPNAWGLHEMHGQIWEWCEDPFRGGVRVRRGGSWLGAGEGVRAGIRDGGMPVNNPGRIGMRPLIGFRLPTTKTSARHKRG